MLSYMLFYPKYISLIILHQGFPNFWLVLYIPLANN